MRDELAPTAATSRAVAIVSCILLVLAAVVCSRVRIGPARAVSLQENLDLRVMGCAAAGPAFDPYVESVNWEPDGGLTCVAVLVANCSNDDQFVGSCRVQPDEHLLLQYHIRPLGAEDA